MRRRQMQRGFYALKTLSLLKGFCIALKRKSSPPPVLVVWLLMLVKMWLQLLRVTLGLLLWLVGRRVR